MPAEACPSFHCRPSTARTLFPASFSIRQMPTTLTKDFGSAPTVSCAKSILNGCWAAITGNTSATNPQAAMPMALRLLTICMTDLLHVYPAVKARGTAGPPPREHDHQRQPAAEPEQRHLGVGDAGIARILASGGRSRDRR